MIDHAAIIARLEAAPEGSRELDVAIAVTIFPVELEGDFIRAMVPHPLDECDAGTYWRKSRSTSSLLTAPHYTASLDAARSLSGWVLLDASDIGADGLALVRLGNPTTSTEVEGIHSRLEIAWCIAALKARGTDDG